MRRRANRIASQRKWSGFETLEPRRVLDAALSLLEGPNLTSSTAAPFRPDTVLVRLANPDLSLPAADLAALGLRPTLRPGLWQAQLPAGERGQQLLAQLGANPLVQSVRPMVALSTELIPNYRLPNDPSLGSLFGMHNTGQNGGTVDADIDAPQAWDRKIDALDVVVADIDTGIDYRHPDLHRNVWINQGEIPTSRLVNLSDIDQDGQITFWDLDDPINQGPGKITDLNGTGFIDGGDILQPLITTDGIVGGPDSGEGGWSNGTSEDPNPFIDDLIGWDFVNGDNDPLDDHGHGTHTAGTIGAMGDNAIGVVGVAWKTRIIALKTFDSTGRGSDLAAAYAVDYAVANSAAISSNSYGGAQFTQELHDAIQNAGAAGHLFVAAAGNYAKDTDSIPFYPAAFDLDNVVSVAATNRKDARSSFSNYGRIIISSSFSTALA